MNQINPQMPPVPASQPQSVPQAVPPAAVQAPVAPPQQPLAPPMPMTQGAPQMALIAQNQEPVNQGVLRTDTGVEYNGFSDDMFDNQQVKFHKIESNSESRFRLCPPFAPKKFYHKADLHWGFTDLEGNKKALTCSKFTEGRCPICEEVDRLTGLVEQYDTSIKSGQLDQMTMTQYTAEIEKLKERIGNIKRKPTYLWNVLTEKGEQKVLSLTWNGHKPLEDKVKFFWNERKINVTDLRANMMIWVSRTGLKAKTRYQYEVLENTAAAIALPEPIKDLSLTYIQRDYNYLAQVLNSGVAPTPNDDPNDRNFSAYGQNAAIQNPPQVPQAAPIPTPPMPPQVPQTALVPPMPGPPAFNANEPIPTQFAPPAPVAPTPPQGQTIIETMGVTGPPQPLPPSYRADDPAPQSAAPIPSPPVNIPPPVAPQAAPPVQVMVPAVMPPTAPVIQTAPQPAAQPVVQQTVAPPVQQVPAQAAAPQIAPLTAQDQTAIGDMMASLNQGVNPS